MKRLIIFLLVVLLLVTSGCAKKKTRYQAEFLGVFDTVTTIVGYSDNKEEFTARVGRIKDKLTEYHRLYDIYHSYKGVNNIKTINDNAGIAPVKVNKELISLLLFAKKQYYATDGKTNIALGSVLRIWHDYREKGISDPFSAELPPRKLLEQAARHTNIEDLIIDTKASTVYLSDPGMSLDVGAVAKGHATERTAQYLEGEGVSSFVLDVGGNVRAIGGKPGQNGIEPWNIGIKNPDKETKDTELCNVLISGYSVVSSGSYERYYTVNGIRYNHIIDPSTLMPATHFADVTIICHDSGLADALSTAVFIMPLEMGKKYVGGLNGVAAMWVMGNGEVVYSKGFKSFLKVDNEK
ncbi:MAG TPA: FAD:protein FMN transferase [Firmicutes bacterium]|jgi:FAD:protein FMN transferase|nr:FAD:protein FMN transferase [Bacillota bacterium]